MGLGETQVFQDEKSRLANTTVARIVAAKGSLNDPETRPPWTPRTNYRRTRTPRRAGPALLARRSQQERRLASRRPVSARASRRRRPAAAPVVAPARPRAEHGPGDDGHRARGRRCQRGVLTRPIRHRRDTSHAGPGGQFVVPLPAAPPPRGPFYPYMAPGHGG